MLSQGSSSIVSRHVQRRPMRSDGAADSFVPEAGHGRRWWEPLVAPRRRPPGRRCCRGVLGREGFGSIPRRPWARPETGGRAPSPDGAAARRATKRMPEVRSTAAEGWDRVTSSPSSSGSWLGYGVSRRGGLSRFALPCHRPRAFFGEGGGGTSRGGSVDRRSGGVSDPGSSRAELDARRGGLRSHPAMLSAKRSGRRCTGSSCSARRMLLDPPPTRRIFLLQDGRFFSQRAKPSSRHHGSLAVSLINADGDWPTIVSACRPSMSKHGAGPRDHCCWTCYDPFDLRRLGTWQTTPSTSRKGGSFERLTACRERARFHAAAVPRRPPEASMYVSPHALLKWSTMRHEDLSDRIVSWAGSEGAGAEAELANPEGIGRRPSCGAAPRLIRARPIARTS